MYQISEAVWKYAKFDPARAAIIDDSGVTSYRDLEEASNRWANYLEGQGVKPGDKVMLLMHNSKYFLDALLALIKLDVTIIPANVMFHANDMQYLYDKVEGTLLISELAFRDTLAAASMNILFREDVTELAGYAAAYEQRPQQHDDLIFFSSGTTGKPKGIVIDKNHFNLNLPIDKVAEEPNTIFVVRPLFFRAHLSTVCLSLQEGKSIVLTAQPNAANVYDIIHSHTITHTYLGPSDLRALMSYMEEHDYTLPWYLEEMITTGATLAEPFKKKLLSRLPHIMFTEYYGSTEGGAISIIDSMEWSENNRGSCGQVMFFSSVKIMDDEGVELPAHRIGEICTTNKLLMKCYYDEPVQTQKCFHGEYLRTGDMGYLDDQGYLYIVGRRQDAICCCGHSFYASEVEKQLRELDMIEEAVVAGMELPDEKDQIPVAFIKMKPGCMDSEARIRDQVMNFCVNKLPSHQVPEHITIIEQVPYNNSGKIDRRLLKSLVCDQIVSKKATV